MRCLARFTVLLPFLLCSCSESDAYCNGLLLGTLLAVWFVTSIPGWVGSWWRKRKERR